ncbi:MAG: hypothetical protein ACK6CU_15595 [Deltaproteobacteria bacterium]|jgi:hypothetical protein
MSVGLFLAWVIVLALALASYAWLAVAVLGASTIARDWKWSVLLPPVAVVVGWRAGGWPRAAALTFGLLATSYAALRILA